MKHQEKKYRADSFSMIRQLLNDKRAKQYPESTTLHYYAQLEGNNVVKLVEKQDRCEIHILEEADGRFTLKEKIPIKDKGDGFKWLKDNGYPKVDVVKMVNTDYEYKDGVIGLYVVNDFLHSVILDFPEGKHEEIEKEFGLGLSEIIEVPYNKYLRILNKSKSLDL